MGASDKMSSAVLKSIGTENRPSLKTIRKTLRTVFQVPININAYISAPSSKALPAHTDPYDVFAIQLNGTKTWDLCYPKSSSTSMLSAQADRALARELEMANPSGCTQHADLLTDANLECEKVIMKPGDVLYLPRGILHQAKADSMSVHLTVAVDQTGSTWKDLFLQASASFGGSHSDELLQLVEDISNESPTGVSWQKMIPLNVFSKGEVARGALFRHYTSLHYQLISFASHSMSSTKFMFGVGDIVRAGQEFASEQTMTEIIKTFSEADEKIVVERTRRDVKCYPGTGGATFRCPDGRTHGKSLQRGGSCGCDGYDDDFCPHVFYL